MTTLALFGNLIAAGTAALAILGHVELWQRKEYRWDRVYAFIKSPQVSLNTLPLFSIGMVLLALGWLVQSSILSWLSLLFFAAHYGLRALRRGLIRPVFTTKVVANLAIITIIALLVLYATRGFSLGLASVIFFLPFITTAVVELINIPFWLKKLALIRRAAQKRQQLTKLTVVGISGSIGKTSTKHFLQSLLKAAGKKTLASAEHRNAELPIAQDILARVKPETELYIAEMGAYRRGEVAAVTRLTQPRFGILTTLGNQHLDLFGSL